MLTRATATRPCPLLAVLLFVPAMALAQAPPGSPDPQKPAEQKQEEQKQADQKQADQKQEDKPPAAVGEEEAAKPTRGFMSALVHNMGDDVKHMPRMNSVYWLMGGTAGAIAIHPYDHEINSHLVGETADRIFVPGKIIGATPTLLGAAAVTYIVGRKKDMKRVQHIGLDEIEAVLLTEGIVEGAKLIARRERPVQPDGTRQTGSYSFPSGHAATTFAFATVLQQHLGYKAAIPTYLIASYVAMSRLHDNRHFASDVVFGAATGIVVGRSVTWHGRNFYATPMFLPDGVGILVARR